jgi:DGQHR domain-containing protein
MQKEINYTISNSFNNRYISFELNIEDIADLDEKSKININIKNNNDPNDNGYQRSPEDKRIDGIVKNILDDDQVRIFGSITCNCRSGLDVDWSKKHGKMKIDDLDVIEIVDGQHRTKAFIKTYHDYYNDIKDNIENIGLLFQVYDGLSINDEIKCFSDINSQQKSFTKSEAQSYKESIGIKKIYSGELNWDTLDSKTKKSYIVQMIAEKINSDTNCFLYKKIKYNNDNIILPRHHLITFGIIKDTYRKLVSDVYKYNPDIKNLGYIEQVEILSSIPTISFDALRLEDWKDSDILTNTREYHIGNKYILKVMFEVFFTIYKEIDMKGEEYNIQNVRSMFRSLDNFNPSKMKKEYGVTIGDLEKARDLLIGGTELDHKHRQTSEYETSVIHNTSLFTHCFA